MIELKSPVPLLDLAALKAFRDAQARRKEQVTSAVTSAEDEAAKARKQIVSNMPETGETRLVGTTAVRLRSGNDAKLQDQIRSHADRQIVNALVGIRKKLDETAVPILKAMAVASDQAEEMKIRHWDKHSVLRRAKGTPTGGDFLESMALRAHYGIILKNAEPIELARWAQQALDSGDLILADAVTRENFGRKRDERPFTNQALLDKLSVPDFDAAQGYLNEVVLARQEAGLIYAKFENTSGQSSIKRIAFGLSAGMPEMDEAGGIIPVGAARR
jgi:sulfur carrier protein ThiS